VSEVGRVFFGGTTKQAKMALHLVGAVIGAAWRHPFLACAVLLGAAVALRRLLVSGKSPFPPNLERVREKAGSQRFRWKTRKAYYFDCAELFKEAHDNVSLLSPPCPNATHLTLFASS
jgi:hypothetical protein